MKIIIDTTNNKHTKISILSGEKHYVKEYISESPKADIALKLIAQILEEHKYSFKDIESIEVKNAPGSYTGLRIGAAIANALSFSLSVPVNDQKVGSVFVPNYE